MDKFKLSFLELFDEPLSVEIDGSTNFKNLEEWDSLIALSLMAMVEEEFNYKLKADDIRNSNTLNDLWNLIQNG